MILWDIIRDWFVHYITGGIDSNEKFFGGGIVGGLYGQTSNEGLGVTTGGSFYLPLQGWTDYGAVDKVLGITFADWLATTGTILVLIAGCVLLFLFVKWLFKMFAGMISGVGR